MYARYTQQGQTCYNVFHFRTGGPASFTEQTTICATYKNWFYNEMRSQVSTGLSLNALFTRDLTSEFAGGIVYTTDLPVAGLDARAQLPMNVTVAVSWRTNQIGKSFRGRSYHLGLVREQTVDSTLTSSQLTALQNIYTALRADYYTVGFLMVVASRFTNGAPRPTGIITDIESVSIDPVLDSQRRRLPGRGR